MEKMDNKIRVAKLWFDGRWCLFQDSDVLLEEVKAFFTETPCYDKIIIEFDEMTPEEIEALPEFTGW